MTGFVAPGFLATGFVATGFVATGFVAMQPVGADIWQETRALRHLGQSLPG